MGDTPREDLFRRCLTSTAVGLALGLTWVLINRIYNSNTVGLDFDSLTLVLLLYPLLLIGVITLGVAVLGLAHLPRAWQIGVGGPIATILVISLWSGMDVDIQIMLAVSVTVGYLIAAFVTATGLPILWRVSVIVLTVALLPIGRGLASARETDRQLDQLAAYGRPLFAPDVPGYQVEDLFVVTSAGGFVSYHLQAADAAQTINVQQSPLTEVSRSHLCDVPSCSPEGPDIWQITSPDDRRYKVVRGDQLIELIPARSVPDADVRKAATSLTEHPADFFVD
jgi:hypothetical protein